MRGILLSLCTFFAFVFCGVAAFQLSVEDYFAAAARGDFHISLDSLPKEFLENLQVFQRLPFVDEVSTLQALVNRKELELRNSTQECQACEAVVAPILSIIPIAPIDVIKAAAEAACKGLGLFADEVCENIDDVFAPWVVYMVKTRARGNITSSMVCTNFLGNDECMDEEADAIMNGWTVEPLPTIKPQYTEPPQPSPDANKVKVLLVTDPHIDLTYLPGSNIDCGLPCCCLGSTGLALPNETSAGYWGTYAGCDMPLHSFRQMLNFIKNNIESNIDMVYFLGDAPAHDVWIQTQESNLEHVTAVVNELKTVLPDAQLYLTLGNHEGLPVNVFPPPGIPDEEFRADWLYHDLANQIAQYLDPTQVEVFKATGCFSIQPMPGLKILNLNNNYGARMNIAVWDDFNDPAKTLEWLRDELQMAEDNGEAVHILTHHPSNKQMMPAWSREYSKILSRYENLIRGVFVGHTHSDSPLILRNFDNISTVVTYINPSFTSRNGKMSEFRILTLDGGYDGASWQLLDIDTYYTPIEDFDQTQEPVYNLLYSAKQDLGMDRLLASDWEAMLQRALTDDNLLQDLVRFEEQNYEWEEELPVDKLDYLCDKFHFNVDQCPLS